MKFSQLHQQGARCDETRPKAFPASLPRSELACLIESYLRKMREALDTLPLDVIARVAEELLRARAQGNTVYVLGNGGSAATASHAATNWRKPHQYREEDGLRAVSLVDNVALLTAWANDTSFDNVFAAQLRSVLVPGDVVVAISGSGNSPNVLRAVEAARDSGAITIGFSGFAGGKLSEIVDVSVNVGCDSQETIEDVHMMLVHALSMALKTAGRDCEQGV
jgi:D-sedoheptulose 7-phosphate isomerase